MFLINIDIDHFEICVVPGKGDKERIVCFDVRTKIHLRKYMPVRWFAENLIILICRLKTEKEFSICFFILPE